MEPDEKMTEMKRLLHDELPEDNYYVLKYLMCFLTEVTHPTCHMPHLALINAPVTSSRWWKRAIATR